MFVRKGNEHMATDEVMANVAKLHEMVENLKLQKQAIVEFAQACNLWHIDVEYNFEYLDVQSDHEQWLASNHNC